MPSLKLDITSKNVFFETNLGQLWKRHVLFVRCSIFYISNHSISFESYDVMTSASTWDRAHFKFIFWILRRLDMNLDQLIDIIMDNTFRKGFPWFKVLDLTSKLMFVKRCTNIWQNLIFILPRIVKNQSKVYLQTSINIYDDVRDFEVWAFTENTKT